MIYTRALSYHFPLARGRDVLVVQFRLRRRGFVSVGALDGLYGHRTYHAVRHFQAARGLRVDGIVGPRTWAALFAVPRHVPPAPPRPPPARGQPPPPVDGPRQDDEQVPSTALDRIQAVLGELRQMHGFRNSVRWQIGPTGLVLEGQATPEVTGGEPGTVRTVWNRFGHAIEEWAAGFSVPVELIIATICTESGGNPNALRMEPGYVSDRTTPGKISPGLMQTLISTARAALGDRSIDRSWLLDPSNSIRAGTAYMAAQWKWTHLDPPKVACAYNAGAVYHDDNAGNRWRMRQYPIGTSAHADRFVRWFNDCFRMFERDNVSPPVSFFRMVRAC